MKDSKNSTQKPSTAKLSTNPYEELRHIDDTQEPLAEEQAQLERLAAFMAEEGMTEKFGITLLHKHFEVADDEMLIETCDPEKRTLMIRPVKKEELANLMDGFRQTQWRYDGAFGLCCVLICVNRGTGHSIAHLPKL